MCRQMRGETWGKRASYGTLTVTKIIKWTVSSTQEGGSSSEWVQSEDSVASRASSPSKLHMDDKENAISLSCGMLNCGERKC